MKKNIMIVFLLIIIFVMTLGYAAFSNNLTINSSSTINSKWDVKITSITTKSITGSAQKKIEPFFSDTSATFGTNLYLPSDSITYEVTIENQGTIDAKVKSIEKSSPTNPAIIFSVSGINENDVLKAKETAIYTVTVTYDPNITTQPENLSANLSVKLNYVQN